MVEWTAWITIVLISILPFSIPAPTPQRIMAAVPAGVDFTPLMTLYLTDRTTYVFVWDA